MQSNLSTLLRRLLASDIDFVLVGGLAAVVHGSPLATQDLDICVAIDETQVKKLRDNIYLETDLGVLDAMSELRPIGDFSRIKKNAVTISIYGHPCKVISLDDLLTIKKTMTRPRDKETVHHLTAIQKTLGTKS